MTRFLPALLWILLTPAAFAAEAPFTWPDNYAVTVTETNKAGSGTPFVNTYRRSGLNARNDSDRFGTAIFRGGEQRKIIIRPDGKVEDTPLSPNHLVSSLFHKNGSWEKIGDESTGGRPAVKYRVQEASRTSFFWLTPDGAVPLRYEHGDVVVHFSDYSTAPQDPALFEAPRQ